jgi:plastocyanin
MAAACALTLAVAWAPPRHDTAAAAQTATSTPTAGLPATTSALGSDIEIAIRDSSYDPAYLTVVPGSTLTWLNYDGELHTVTSEDRLFDGEMGPRERLSLSFDRPGVYFYFCVPHDWMIGEITVVAAPAQRSPTPIVGAAPSVTAGSRAQ